MTTQSEKLLYRAYSAIAEGISKQDEDQLLVDMEMYIQQKELEEKAIQVTVDPQLN